MHDQCMTLLYASEQQAHSGCIHIGLELVEAQTAQGVDVSKFLAIQHGEFILVQNGEMQFHFFVLVIAAAQYVHKLVDTRNATESKTAPHSKDLEAVASDSLVVTYKSSCTFPEFACNRPACLAGKFNR
eukprot:1150664-Pelagomonas_calceolata.AAC.2